VSRQGIRTGILGLTAGVLLLAACSGGATSEQPGASEQPVAAGGQPSARTESTAALEGVAAEAAAFGALDSAAQEKELAAASDAAELALFPDSAGAAYAAVTANLVKQARAYQATPDFGHFGAGPGAADEGGFGGMTFAGWLIGGLGMQAVVSGSNDVKQGQSVEPVTKKDTFDGGTSEMTMTGSVASASLDWNLTSTQKGMTGSVHVKGKIDPCPDVNGMFTASVTLDTEGASDSGGASSNVAIALTGLVDENAAILGYETTTNSRAKSGARGQVADITATTTYGAGGVTAATRSANAASGGTADEGQQWGNLGMMTETIVTKGIMDAIHSAIESGRCVQLNAPTTPAKTSALKPSTAVSIAAQPRSKVDGTPTGGTITGQLEGGASLDPSGTKVDADATFSYVAPDKEDERASVVLVSRSIRGVGKATIPFDTVVIRGYAIGQKVGPLLYHAVNCGSAAGPWTITYELVDLPGMKGGGVITLTFPKEPAPHDETEIITTVGTDKGEYKAVGLPGGVKFGGPASAKLQRYGAHLKLEITTSGMATGYAPGKQKTMAENAGTVLLVAQAASATECPTN
jgi:hypothetical protein